MHTDSPFIEWGLIAEKIRKKGGIGFFLAGLIFLCYADYGLTIR